MSLSSLPSPFKPLPASVAHSRLKINSFALALLTVFRSIFTPYRQFRRGVIWFADEYVQGRARGHASWAGRGFWWLETILTVVTLWNIVEAYISVRSPAAPAKAPGATGLQLTPSRVSSPLTRAYPLTATKGPSTPSVSTPTRPSSSSQSQNYPSSALARTSSNNNNTPGRASPLSQSTAKALNLPFRPRESTGLFFPEEAGASPSKVGRGSQGAASSSGGNSGGAASGGGVGRTGSTDEFVMVEREEKEWVDNVWKGVRGKGGRVGL
ncbi:uncharacterized protein MKK02DRAFT_44148 [Dioszegia hungarica]|uniref:Uncharacterized protein n=1 Tax=Dioszegia hungarica TaxID=4972 RepID=A0AA38LUA4_9TREE|nr:uncharacterized protein MKK02DRAFT_44148 [Dioszegia hungarica]KAI9635458.1 hypothetical protein MKK02DRAFT_44148 [Dioszegia hungarica]